MSEHKHDAARVDALAEKVQRIWRDANTKSIAHWEEMDIAWKAAFAAVARYILDTRAEREGPLVKAVDGALAWLDKHPTGKVEVVEGAKARILLRDALALHAALDAPSEPTLEEAVEAMLRERGTMSPVREAVVSYARLRDVEDALARSKAKP